MQVMKKYNDFAAKYNLLRKASVPEISEIESDGNPRVSKFGGKFPYLPDETIPECTHCHQFPMMVAQLYVPSLPHFIQDLFPESQRQSLIVLSICPSCLGFNGYNVNVYSEDQLDQLIYHDDVGQKWATPEMNMMRICNFRPGSPHSLDELDQQKQFLRLTTVTSWRDAEMAPYSSVKEVKDLMEKEKIESNQRMFLAAHDINIKNCIAGHSYVGGWPHFTGDDQTPEHYKILLNITESEEATLEWGNGGTAQLWIGTDENAGKFKFTCWTNPFS